VAPGAGWGGRDFVNPGYFAPAWYRVYKDFDKTPGHDWDGVIDQVGGSQGPGAWGHHWGVRKFVPSAEVVA
jgi:hypothetical protein